MSQQSDFQGTKPPVPKYLKIVIVIECFLFRFYRDQIKNVNAALKMEHLLFPKYCVTVSEPAFLTDVDFGRAHKQMLLSVARLYNLFFSIYDLNFPFGYLFRPLFESIYIDIVQHLHWKWKQHSFVSVILSRGEKAGRFIFQPRSQHGLFILEVEL